ncbi:glycosyltransferase [Kitasatospora viridis]|uniref:Galactosyltransferase-like protein n=1 Tax=Kitasatospora viridis TaxID=281105 RepID=A0A561UHT5_9ACTN|nr:galactosyltransferase-related protein [Kitasatospora viridis]TWF98929.1 galactosyltransferase-like protein [Kitasatospora viridis]
MTDSRTEAAAADATLAARLAAYVVLAHDPAVPQIAADYWELSEESYHATDRLVAELVARADPAAQAAYRELVAAPTEPGRQFALRHRLRELLAREPERAAGLRAAVAGADERIWIDYHLGEAVEQPPAAAPAPDVQVVIPFRDREHGLRTRNLLACLRALADQRGDAVVHVTVVEADAVPRSRELLDSMADEYLFARKDGLFNKSWTVNVGVVATARPAPVVCVLDADILVERDFVERNLRRLREGAHGAHLPFRWSLSLDEASTRRAIARRTRAGAAEVPGSVLRGLLLREPPGGCVWVRSAVFHAVGGFDERYEGWGGEDDDVVARLDRAAGVARFDDELLHLDHPRPAMTRDTGVPFNAHLEPLSWTPEHGYGDLARFAG